mgnify:CR=1 FL=1
MNEVIREIRIIAYAALMLAAVYVGHYATVKGQAENIQCFAPIGLEGKN